MDEYFNKCCLVLFESSFSDAIPPGSPSIYILQTGKPYLILRYSPDAEGNAEMQITDSTVPERIRSAFKNVFDKGFRKVILIPSSVQLNDEVIQQAFLTLKLMDFCLGPDDRGGLYLVGMNSYEPSVFDQLEFQQIQPVKRVISNIGRLKKAIYRMPVLQAV